MPHIFTIYRSPKAQKGEVCTREKYLEIADNESLLALCNQIAAEEDHDVRSDFKKLLPVITWQAAFDGKRISKEAKPSGLFMLDIDHVDDPYKLYSEKIAKNIKHLGIVYVGKTASCHGLRIVAKCKPELHTIEECQRWLASNLKVEFDGVCKDWARCSFVVHDSYTYFMDSKAIWVDDPEAGEVYAAGQSPVQTNAAMEKMLQEAEKADGKNTRTENANDGGSVDQREGLFGGPADYKGVSYQEIATEWLIYTGGEPMEGERNARLYKLALRMRYITDFNQVTMLRVMPRYGLSEEEMRSIIASACSTTRAADMPKDMIEVLERIDKRRKLGEQNDENEDEIPILKTDKMPSLPPVLRQWYEIAPDDFKKAVTLCQLPILGALGSRLRARYLDGVLQSPSFQVSLEAPQASGKSFMVRLAQYELAQMMSSDDAARELERQYQDKVAEMKLLNIKINADNKEQILGTKPKAIIRYVPATMSITKLLMRMEAAQGLHLFALAEEIDTVLKAFRKGFSSFSDALRVSFDNGLYGQDYASDQSFSGIVPLYYNCLFSGTPKAMCRFYPDVEDGLVSRVLFVSLPDQFGKPMPVWREFTKDERNIVEIGLVRLNEISLQGSEVQPEHEMKMEWLNKHMKSWIIQQQQEAVKEDDRTRDIFCRRAAVVGFRAGMLAYFLWGEKSTPTIRKNTCDFAIWVANSMLNQHLLRFRVTKTHSNVNKWEEPYKALGDTFSRNELTEVLKRFEVESAPRIVIFQWKTLGIIKEIQSGKGVGGTKAVMFQKIK